MGEKVMSKREQETSIIFNAADKEVKIYSANPSVIHKLDKMCQECPDMYRCVWEDDVFFAKKYRLKDKRYLRFAKPRTAAMSDEKKAELSERMRCMREKAK